MKIKITPNLNPSQLAWEKNNGLLPIIIQDIATYQVLMLGFMNEEALSKTLETGLVTFYSRSRQSLWVKGETSGNYLHVKEIYVDCDQDTLLILATPKGATCHEGTYSCFPMTKNFCYGTLTALSETIKARALNPNEESYTSQLLNAGMSRMAQKVGEEGVEVALAAVENSPKLTEELADLFYHVMVLLEAKNLSLENILECLARRHNRLHLL